MKNVMHALIHWFNVYKEGYEEIYCIIGEWFADGFYITNATADNKECLGARLVAINGIDL